MASVTLRMSLALAVALAVLVWLRRGALFTRPGVWKVYLVASLGIFPNMPLVYWSAQFVPSGWMAVIFALSPFVTGLLSMVILRENPFNRLKVLALLIALVGLVIIFWGQLQVDVRSVYGIGGLLLSCVLFGISSVLLKCLYEGTDVFRQSDGDMMFSVIGLLFTFSWLYSM